MAEILTQGVLTNNGQKALPCLPSSSLVIPLFMPLLFLRSRNRSNALRNVFQEHMKTVDERRVGTYHQDSISRVSSPNFQSSIQAPFSNANKRVKIFFYEWSDTNNNPLIFHELHVFQNWCERNHVTFTIDIGQVILTMGECHIACEPNKTLVMIANCQWRLQTMLNEKWKIARSKFW